MNDDKDMPLNPVGDDALEARIVAWVLGEASSFEAEELERLCNADPALRLFERRMRVLHGLIADDKKVGPDPEWQLPESKREKIAALFAEVPSENKEKDTVLPIRRSQTGRRALLALAACTVVSISAWSLLQQMGSSRKYSVAALPEVPEAKADRARESNDQAREELRRAIAVQEDAVEDKRKLLSQIIRTEGITYEGGDSAEVERSIARGGIAMETMVDAKHDYEASVALLEQLKTKGISEGMQMKLSDDALASNESTEFKASGGAGGGQGTSSPPPSGPPAKKSANGYSSLWASSPFTTKSPANADVQASVMPESEAGALALSDAPAESKGRAKQDSKDAADLRGLPVIEPQSPAAPPPAAAMPAQRPAAAEKAEAESELLAKRQQGGDPFGGAAGEADIVSRFRGDADWNVVAAGQPVTATATAGNPIDAILDDPNRPADAKSAEDGAMAGTTAGFATLDEATKFKSEIFTASPSRAAAAHGFAAGGDMDADISADAVAGAFKMDLMPSEARAKSESFAFDDIGQMGELAEKLPEDQGRFDLFYSQAGSPEVTGGITGLQDLARKNQELQKEGGEAPWAGGLFSPGQTGGTEVDSYVARSLKFHSDLGAKPASGVEVTREYHYSDRELPEQQEWAKGATALGLEGATQFFGTDSLPRESKGAAAADPFASALFLLNSGGPGEAPTTDDELRRNLYTAEGHFKLGKYDDAHRAYEDVLRTDPYNKAARRGMEQVAMARADYYPAAYDSSRAQLLAEVDRAWELSVPQVVPDGTVTPLASMVDKRKSIIVPEIDLKNATVEEAVDLLQIRAVELDVAELDPAKKGFKFSLEKPAEGSDQADVSALRIPELRLENVALGDAIKQVADAAGLEYAYNDTGVILKPGAKTPKRSEVTLDAMAEVVAAAEPFSTFSLHVSDASFKLAKAALDRGEIPADDSIRPEEFYNAFDYGDPSPASGEPVVCAVEQSAHPAFPQRNLLRVGIKTGSQGRGQSTPLNLTLLLDNSGSMEREDRSAGLANAVQQLSSLLKEGDTITVAGFSRQPRLLADRLPGARAQELNGLIAQTPSEGGTNLEEGLKLGEELAKRQFNPAAQNRVVLFTDGAANLGDARPEALQARVEGLRQQGIAFDAAGFGAEGLNDKLLERLTRNGNGRYYIVDRAEDADAGFAKQLAGAFRPAAENVKVQIRFNPARVAKYKLIGFEEHRLKKEDFRNDAVDAAEMAAEEAGNALYQIEVLPQGEGEVGEVSVRFRDAASGQMVERTWTIPYDLQAPAFDQAKPAIQLAGLAAFAAEKLRGAPMADAIDLQQLAPVLAKVKARYPNSQPVADLGAMIGKLK